MAAGQGRRLAHDPPNLIGVSDLDHLARHAADDDVIRASDETGLVRHQPGDE